MWEPPRWNALLKQENGATDLAHQFNFVWYELTHTHTAALKALKSASNLRDATLAIENLYEHPGGTPNNPPPYFFNNRPSAHTSKRLTNAQDVLNGNFGDERT